MKRNLRIVPAVAPTRLPLDIGHSKTLKATRPLRPDPNVEQIRVLFARFQPSAGEDIRDFLNSQQDFQTIGEAPDAGGAVRLAVNLKPDVLLLELSTPKLALALIRELRIRSPQVPIVVLAEALQKPDMIAFFQSGVRGVMLKTSSTQLLSKCIRKVHAGELWIGRETVADILEILAAQTVSQSDLEPPWPSSKVHGHSLTPREHQILHLIIEGETNKGISARLNVGPDTVKHHLTSIFDKTGTSSRLALALFALEHGLISKD